MQTMIAPIWLLWIILCPCALAAGVFLLIKGFRHRSPGNDPHCSKCDYNLTGLAADVCPECGTQYSPATIIYGERRRHTALVAAGGLLCLLGLASCLLSIVPRNRPAAPKPSLTRMIGQAKTLTSNLKRDFERGIGPFRPPLAEECHPDAPIHVLAYFVDGKIRPGVAAIPDATVRVPAQALVTATNALITKQIHPIYERAMTSPDPSNVKTLALLMDQLDKYLDRLQQIVKGY